MRGRLIFIPCAVWFLLSAAQAHASAEVLSEQAGFDCPKSVAIYLELIGLDRKKLETLAPFVVATKQGTALTCLPLSLDADMRVSALKALQLTARVSEKARPDLSIEGIPQYQCTVIRVRVRGTKIRGMIVPEDSAKLLGHRCVLIGKGSIERAMQRQ